MAALYTYFVCSLSVYFLTDPSILKYFLLVFISVMCLRATLQLFLMYRSKAWVPAYGMLFNIVTALILAIGLIYNVFVSDITSNHNQLLSLFFLLTIGMLLLDSYYAYRFNQLVGEDNTQGDQAIWFANANDPRFRRINKLTFFFNFIILSLISILVCRILIV